MFRALALVFLLPLTAFADDPPAKKPADQFDRLQAVLHEKKAKSFGDETIKNVPLATVLNRLEKEFKDDGLKFVIREDLFHAKFPETVTDRQPYGDQKICISLTPKDLTVHEFLTHALRDVGAVYLVRNNHIEIIPPEAANPLGLQLAALHDKKVSSFRKVSIKGLSLATVTEELEYEFREDALKIVIREDVFRSQYPDKEVYSQERFKGDLKPTGLSLHEFLTLALSDIGATYLLRRNYIEITTVEAAVAEWYPKDLKGDMPRVRLQREPLVSYHTDGQSASEAINVVSERYGRQVYFDLAAVPRRKEAVLRSEYIRANWANVPFNTAIRMLALGAGWEVTEKDGMLTITNPVKKKKGK